MRNEGSELVWRTLHVLGREVVNVYTDAHGWSDIPEITAMMQVT